MQCFPVCLLNYNVFDVALCCCFCEFLSFSVCVRVRACVRACVRARARACVCVVVFYVSFHILKLINL